MTKKKIISEAMRMLGKRTSDRKRKAGGENLKKARAARWPNKRLTVE